MDYPLSNAFEQTSLSSMAPSCWGTTLEISLVSLGIDESIPELESRDYFEVPSATSSD